MTRAVEIARQVEPLLADTAADDESWRRRQDTVHAHVQELRDRLIAHGHQPETHQVEDLVLVRCVFQGRPHTMTELRNALAAEIGERERLLAAREQEIIENHLLGEIAVELQRLIRAAESWISLANRELAARPTSTGLRFRFALEAEPEGAFAEVRRPFLRTSELWTPAERGNLTRFLQERIRAEQAANEDGSWRDHRCACPVDATRLPAAARPRTDASADKRPPLTTAWCPGLAEASRGFVAKCKPLDPEWYIID